MKRQSLSCSQLGIKSWLEAPAGETTQNKKNPFNPPVRGIPGSVGLRSSRISARLGGNGLIRKYGIMLKRQEFREKAEEIGFRKYR